MTRSYKVLLEVLKVNVGYCWFVKIPSTMPTHTHLDGLSEVETKILAKHARHFVGDPPPPPPQTTHEPPFPSLQPPIPPFPPLGWCIEKLCMYVICHYGHSSSKRGGDFNHVWSHYYETIMQDYIRLYLKRKMMPLQL